LFGAFGSTRRASAISSNWRTGDAASFRGTSAAEAGAIGYSPSTAGRRSSRSARIFTNFSTIRPA
jgi:hypothetical protein